MAAFHRRRLKESYRALLFDGVVLTRKTGAGPVKRPVPVALGIRHDGKKEIIDFKLARSESADEWEAFLISLTRRGLTGKGTEVISVDGGSGLISAVRSVYPLISLQRCRAHKMRNILDKVRKPDRNEAKKGLAKIYGAKNLREARSAAKRWVDAWENIYPAAVKCLRDDLDDLADLLWFCRYILQTEDTNNQRHRADIQGSPQKDEAHGGLREQNKYGEDPLCGFPV